MRKILFLFAACLGVAWRVSAAETLTMSDGAAFTGDIVKSDDNGLLLRTGESYTNLAWGRFSQESLKQLAANPKIRPLVEVFIEPDQSQRPAKAEIQINPVTRLERPANPSLFGGLAHSAVGWCILLVLYLANLYAAFEISVIRARPASQVIGLSAILPVIGPVIFLAMPIKMKPAPEEIVVDGNAAAPGRPARTAEEIQIIEASWKPEEKKPEVQVFARGKFTFNKRFVETKFAGYLVEPKGDALKFTMELKSAKGQFTIERIMQVAAADVIFETAQRGQVTVPLADILEIKLTPKAV
ncbi:MAG TPA: hypothetical protein VGI63_01520 [Verrucomicrobiae bacterium]